MSKLLKPLIIVLFVLSIGALVLGTMLYQKKEIVKGRTQTLEQSVATIARNLEYKGLNRDSLKDLEAMTSQLNALSTAAKTKHDDLVATSETLEQTKSNLQQTEQTLETTKTELRQSEDEVASLEDDVSTKLKDINRKKEQIATLEEEMDELNDQISQLENDYTIAQASISDHEAEYAALLRDFEDCVKQGRPTGDPNTPGKIIGQDFVGTILLVNPEWNFVVIDKGSADELSENVILLVHRGLEPIGKVRISRVEDNISVAEIVSAWDSVDPVAGDGVISPKSS